MAISTNQKPTIYRNLYEDTDTDRDVEMYMYNLPDDKWTRGVKGLRSINSSGDKFTAMFLLFISRAQLVRDNGRHADGN